VERLLDALTMDDEEQARRMRTMRSVVAEFNVYRWPGQMLADAVHVRDGPTDSDNDSLAHGLAMFPGLV
jgi:trehalose-6-phosphate synthase